MLLVGFKNKTQKVSSQTMPDNLQPQEMPDASPGIERDPAVAVPSRPDTEERMYMLARAAAGTVERSEAAFYDELSQPQEEYLTYHDRLERIAANDQARGSGESLATSLETLSRKLYIRSMAGGTEEQGQPAERPLLDADAHGHILGTIARVLLAAQENEALQGKGNGAIWRQARNDLADEIRALARARKERPGSAALSAALEDALDAHFCLETATEYTSTRESFYEYESDDMHDKSSLAGEGLDQDVAAAGKRAYKAGIHVRLPGAAGSPYTDAHKTRDPSTYLEVGRCYYAAAVSLEKRTGRHFRPESGQQFGQPFPPALTKREWHRALSPRWYNKFAGKGSPDLYDVSRRVGLDKAFTGQDAQAILDIKGDAEGSLFLAKGLNLFAGLSKQTADTLVANGYARDVYRSLTRFEPGILTREFIESHTEAVRYIGIANGPMDALDFQPDASLAQLMLDNGGRLRLAENLDAFEAKTLPEEVFLDLVSDYPVQVLENLSVFASADRGKLLDAMMQRSWAVIEYKDVLGVEFNDALAKKLAEAGAMETLLDNLNSFDGLTYEAAEMIMEYSYPESIEKLISLRDRFEGLNDTRLLEMLRQRQVMYLLPPELADSLNVKAEFLNSVEYEAIGSVPYGSYPGEFADYIERLDSLPFAERPRATEAVLKIFGEYASLELTQSVRRLLEGDISEDLRTFGVSRSAEAGLRQLEVGVREALDMIRKVDIPLDQLERIERSAVLKSVLMDVSRYRQSQWGNHDVFSLDELLTYRIRLEKDGMLGALPPAYAPSKAVEIGLLNARDKKAEWTVDVLERFNVLRQELVEAARPSKEGGGMNALMGRLRGDIAGMITDMDERLAADTTLNAKGRHSIERRRDELLGLITPTDPVKSQTYPLRSLKTFEQNFLALAQNKELHSSMRKLVFAWALYKNPNWAKEHPSLLNTEAIKSPSTDDVADLRQFVETIVNQQTFREYFADTRSARAFNKMVDTKSLDTGLSRLQGIGVGKDTLSMQFVPTRGIMMELSGHIGDACWAGVYKSIAETMPNMTAVIMKQRPGTAHESLAGSAMLIESKTRWTHRPILIIRGLNPIQNTINHISATQFFDAFVGYARNIAEERGMGLGIVIDDHVGGSGTNRPVLYDYMSKTLKPTLRKVRMLNADTNFNGYKITGDTYEL